MNDTAFSATEIVKHYGEIEALRGVSVSGVYGQIMGIVGDNGAGKSTFCRILSGAEGPTSGSVEIGGTKMTTFNPREAASAGVGTIYQNIPLALHSSVSDNIFMGQEIVKRPMFFGIHRMDRRLMAVKAKDALAAVGVDVDPRRQARALSGGQRQAVAVARMVLFQQRVVVMDEPTAALSVDNRKRVYDAVHGLASSGACVLMVGHNLPEILAIAHRVVIFRQGRIVADVDAGQASEHQLLQLMSGVKPQEMAR
ncbi:MAG: ATP-binding cassette domain-containing protein [Actinobacteria bacterium]|nr:ATP-binding cassette domain-containing protein [Actinomycetota bacterium]MCL5447401.1 ATP-binding cassette domain-containing protein [Actinomycetota bacterium]